jgi:uncharacterized OsmC-like protein
LQRKSLKEREREKLLKFTYKLDKLWIKVNEWMNESMFQGVERKKQKFFMLDVKLNLNWFFRAKERQRVSEENGKFYCSIRKDFYDGNFNVSKIRFQAS